MSGVMVEAIDGATLGYYGACEIDILMRIQDKGFLPREPCAKFAVVGEVHCQQVFLRVSGRRARSSERALISFDSTQHGESAIVFLGLMLISVGCCVVNLATVQRF